MPADKQLPRSNTPQPFKARPRPKKLPPPQAGLLQAVGEGAGAPLTSAADPVPTPESSNNTSSDTVSPPIASETSSEISTSDFPADSVPTSSEVADQTVEPAAEPAETSPPAATPEQWFLKLSPPEGEAEDETFDSQEELVTRLKELVLDKESLTGVKVEVFRGRRLGLSPFPYPYLQDGDDLIALFTMPNEIVISTDGFLVPRPQAAIPVPAAEAEEPATEEEETAAGPAEVGGEDSAIESLPEETEAEALAEAIAGAITPAGDAEGDNYGAEPEAPPG